MSKHTTGPWWIGRGTLSIYNVDRRIADIKQSADNDQDDANARLIAAAPELLEALRGMLQLDEEHHQRHSGDEDVCVEVRAARAAIAKATGGAA